MKINQIKSLLSEIFKDNSIVLLICPALFLYTFSNEINLISLNGLVYRKICLANYNTTTCDILKNFSNSSTIVQEITSNQMLVLNISFLIPAILALVK
jgi:hypothetical protein